MKGMTQAEFDLLKTLLVAAFNDGLASKEEEWKRIAGLVPSNNRSNTYAWLSKFPAFREWIGPRLHKRLAETAMQVTNRKFENTLDVEVEDWEDGNTASYPAIARSYGESVIDLKNDLIFNLLNGGFTMTCYDGQYFFDTDHPVYPTEDGSGTATPVSNMQDGTGEPWLLLCTKRAAKPFYLQERIKAQFYSVTSPQNDTVFNEDVISFGGRYRGEGVLGFWQCAFGSKAELSGENFDAAYEAMMKYPSDGGKPLNMRPDLLIVGPANRAAARELILADKIGGTSNTNYKIVDLMETAYLKTV